MDVMKMKAMHRPLQLSFFFHGIIFLAIITLNMSPVITQNILVVDFSMENTPHVHEGCNTATVTIPAKLKKNPKSIHVTESTVNQNNEVLKPPVVSEPTDTQNLSQKDPQTPVMTLSEVSQDITMGSGTFSYIGSQSSIHESGSQAGSSVSFSISGKGDMGSSDKARYLKAHFSYIKDLIHKHLIYPAKAKKMGWEGKVITSFIVSSNGCAKDVRISKSSGYEILDENAIKAITSASPFPEPPTEAQIIIPILYRLN